MVLYGFVSDCIKKNNFICPLPVYRWNYDWSNEQCEKLYRDIIEAVRQDRQHFTGTIIYIEDVNGGSGLNEVLIIEWQ